MGDYFAHWVRLGQRADQAKLPKIFYVNWFKKDADGRFVWPGFGENSRVIKWIVERLEGRADAVSTPIGNVPTPDAIDTEGLDLSARDLEFLLEVDRDIWKQEAALVPEFFKTFGDQLPSELWDEYHALLDRLGQ
jgi:phosphoenolpyruvate carboxykinase (GTP)